MNKPLDTELLTSSIAEQALIGSIVYFGDRITELDTVIEMLPTSAMFSDATFRDVWDAILTVHNSNLNVSKMSVAAELQSKGHRHPDTTLSAIADEIQETACGPELIEYSKQISASYQRLELVKLGYRLRLVEAGADVNRIIQEEIEPTLDRISGLSTANEGRWLEEMVIEKCQKLEDGIPLYNAQSVLRTRIAALDGDINGGLFPGHLIVVCAPPSGGKTSLSLDIAQVNAGRGKRTLYYCPDETENSISDRALTSGTAIPKWKFSQKDFLDDEMEQIIQTRHEHEAREGGVLVVDGIRCITEITNHAKRRHRKHGVDLIVVDYIQQVTPANGRKYANRTDEMTSVAMDLKVLAKILNVPVIGVSQFSRQRAGGQTAKIKSVKDIPHPKMEWLRDSGAIEQEANLILATVVPLLALKAANGEDDEVYQKELLAHNMFELPAKIHILKNKEGATGTTLCAFNAHRMRFCSPAINAGLEPVETYECEDGQGEMPF